MTRLSFGVGGALILLNVNSSHGEHQPRGPGREINQTQPLPHSQVHSQVHSQPSKGRHMALATLPWDPVRFGP